MYMAAPDGSHILEQTLTCVCLIGCALKGLQPLLLSCLTGRLQEASGVCHGQMSAGALGGSDALTQGIPYLQECSGCPLPSLNLQSDGSFSSQSVRFYPLCIQMKFWYDDEFCCILGAKCCVEDQDLEFITIVFICYFWTVAFVS